MEITYRVRWYQKRLHSAIMGEDVTKAIAIWHRRAGKDDVCIHGMRDLSQRRPGTYWHCLPEYEQARKAIWDAVDANTGMRRIDTAFPKEAGFQHDQQKMMVTMPWGATWQLIGSDRYDATVGAGPVGIVYSEWALANPSAYAYHKPMLRESKGKAVFITTPRGNNHAKRMFDAAVGPEWFRERLTARDTGALTEDDLDAELRDYQSLWGLDFGRAYFEQEYLCSWSGAQVGSYFGAEVNRAEAEGRICDVPVDPSRPVHTVWDLGKATNNPIWCIQVVGNRLHVVDFYQPESEDIQDWATELRDVRGYDGNAYVPHDILATEWGKGRTRIELMRSAGFKAKRIPRVSVADGLQAGRIAINHARFDADRCDHGIDGLRAYRREWDDQMKTFRDNPVKDWAEHIGSAWRYVGLAYAIERPQAPEPKPSHPVLTVDATGRVQSNMSLDATVRDFIKRRERRARM